LRLLSSKVPCDKLRAYICRWVAKSTWCKTSPPHILRLVGFAKKQPPYPWRHCSPSHIRLAPNAKSATKQIFVYPEGSGGQFHRIFLTFPVKIPLLGCVVVC